MNSTLSLLKPIFRSIFIGISGGICLFFMFGCQTVQEVPLSEIREERSQAFDQQQVAREEEDKEPARPMLDGKLSLDEALLTAMRHNREINAILQERVIAEGGVLESYSSFLPRLGTEAGYTRLDEAIGIDLSEIGLAPGRNGGGGGGRNRYSTGFNMVQPLYRGGAIPATVRRAKLSRLLADETIRSAAQKVIFQTQSTYYDVILARYLLAVERDAVKSTRAHLKNVRERREQGLATDFEVLRAQVDVSLYEAARIRQQNEVDLATTELLKVLGVSQESEIELTGDLVHNPLATEYLQELRRAYKNRPDLYLAELRIKSQEETLAIERSRYLPEINAWADYEWSRPEPTLGRDQWDDSWRAGLSLSMPLFEGLQRKGRVEQEEARLKQRQYELAETEDQAREQVRRAILEIENAEEFVDSQRLNLELAEEALKLAEAGYREGVNEAVEVTEARAALTRARGLYYEAVYSHILAVLSLERATGKLGPGPGTEPLEEEAWKTGRRRSGEKE